MAASVGPAAAPGAGLGRSAAAAAAPLPTCGCGWAVGPARLGGCRFERPYESALGISVPVSSSSRPFPAIDCGAPHPRLTYCAWTAVCRSHHVHARVHGTCFLHATACCCIACRAWPAPRATYSWDTGADWHFNRMIARINTHARAHAAILELMCGLIYPRRRRGSVACAACTLTVCTAIFPLGLPAVGHFSAR